MDMVSSDLMLSAAAAKMVLSELGKHVLLGMMRAKMYM